jgi:hypothetical protein
MRLRSLLAAAALLSTSLFARADSFTTFDLTSTFIGYNGQAGGGTISGTLTLDNTLGDFTGADLTASGFSNPIYNTALDNIDFGGGPYFGSVGLFPFSNTGITLNLYLMASTLTGYTGSGICSLTSSPACGIYALTSYTPPSSYVPPPGTGQVLLVASSGTLEPETPAPTPEPSSVLLLATGLLGIAILSSRLQIEGRA